MPKKRKTKDNLVIGMVIGLIAVVGFAVFASATDLFRFEGGLDSPTINVVNRLLDLAEGEQALGGDLAFGGSTSADWNVDKEIQVGEGIVMGMSGVLDFGFGTSDSYTGNATATAVQVCDNPIWKISSEEATTFGIPSSLEVIAECLKVQGACKTVKFVSEATTSVPITIIAVDSYTGGGTSGRTILTTSHATSTAVILDQNEIFNIEFCNLDGATSTVTVVETVRK